MMKKNLKYLLALLCIIVLLLCTGCSSNNAAPQPISITVWTYYNGTLLESFNTLVKTFNETVGKEKGIIVEAYSQGSVNELEASVMQSAEGKVGAAAMPNIFSAYADTAYAPYGERGDAYVTERTRSVTDFQLARIQNGISAVVRITNGNEMPSTPM